MGSGIVQAPPEERKLIVLLLEVLNIAQTAAGCCGCGEGWGTSDKMDGCFFCSITSGSSCS